MSHDQRPGKVRVVARRPTSAELGNRPALRPVPTSGRKAERVLAHTTPASRYLLPAAIFLLGCAAGGALLPLADFF